MTPSTGQRKKHFKNTQSYDPNIRPFGEWAEENRRFHAGFCLWLRDGGYGASALNIYSVAARLAVGYLDKPASGIDSDSDLAQVMEFLNQRGLTPGTLNGYRKGLLKLGQYLRYLRQLPESCQSINWEGYLRGLPNWLAEGVRNHVLQRSNAWNDANRTQNTRNELSRLCTTLRGMIAVSALTTFEDIKPKLWFAWRAGNIHLKPAMFNAKLNTLKSFLRFVVENGHGICAKMLDVRPIRAEPGSPRDLPVEQVKMLLKTPVNSLDKAWMLLMLHSGLRTGEVRKLRWEEVDLERRTLRIEESKDLQSRVIFLSPQTVEALNALPVTMDYVFTRHYLPLSRRYCQSRLETIGKSCDVRATPHQLRHTAATLLLNAGMSIWSLKAFLGHRNVDTTLRYAKPYDDRMAEEYMKTQLT